jgi:uncharacterized protein
MKRILTIDGGGVLGVFPASFLASIEDHIEGKVHEYFDLIVGTSTGGIIALGLGMGFSGKEVLEMYKRFCPVVFGGWRIPLALKRFFRVKYGRYRLWGPLEGAFSQMRLGEAKVRLAIPALRALTAEPKLFTTAHHKDYTTDYKERVVTVAMATSAAPTYFESCYSRGGVPLIDGGLWANNPTYIGAVEAVHKLGWSKEDVRLLSLACNKTSIKLRDPMNGIPKWATRVSAVLTTAQSYNSMNIASFVIGAENVFRVEPDYSNDNFKLDSLEGMCEFESAGVDECSRRMPLLKETFFSERAEPFIPVYHL